MITKISFENYKSFKEKQTLELRPMTILIGKNSSGKSAILKLLSMLERALSADFEEPLSLNNNGIELGVTFKDLIFGRKQISDLTFELETNRKKKLTVKIASGIRDLDTPKIIYWKLNNEAELIYNDHKKNYFDIIDQLEYDCEFNGLALDSRTSVHTETSAEVPSLSKNKIKLQTLYFCPYRKIPDRIIYIKDVYLKNKVWNINGENMYLILIQDFMKNDGAILKAASQWYQTNFEDWSLQINATQAPEYKIELTRSEPKVQINIRDVGQGMSQVLPIVVDALLPPASVRAQEIITIIEEPELHLHPAAHGNLAELLVDAMKKKGKKYLIETHSQNFVLRIRRLIAEDKLNKDNVMIYYVDYDDETGESHLKPIQVDADGKVNFWPENVFSETLEETLAIRTAQLNRPKKAS
jgi:predicted ATPase